MASAAATIPVLSDGAVFSAYVISFSFEIVSVTGGTERSVLGPGPRNRAANGITVTAVTARISSVITRVVSIRVMTKVGRRPGVGGMTYVALFRRG